MSKYQYIPTNVKYVKENPEEYIIDDCLEACKILWSKGIDTTQCSNLEDRNSRWIEIDSSCLSQENKNYIYEQVNSKTKGYVLSGKTHEPTLCVDMTGPDAQKALCELANSLSLQDTVRFCSADQCLDDYKRVGGKLITLPNGDIQPEYNPQHANATLADALTYYDEWELYIEEENRVYENKEALAYHLEYLQKISEENTNKRSL